MMPMEMIT